MRMLACVGSQPMLLDPTIYTQNSDNGNQRMKFLNSKCPSFHLWKVWGILLLLLSSCTSASTATSATPTMEQLATQTERPAESTVSPSETSAPIPTELSGPSFTNPVYND